MNNNLRKLTTTGALVYSLLFIGTNASAQKKVTAEESLNRLKSNYENSVQNLNLYIENSKISQSNVQELDKLLTEQKQKQVKIEQVNRQNKLTAEKIKQQETDIQLSIQAEEKEIQIEEQRIQDLQKLIAQLKLNQEKRRTKIAEYNKDKQSLAKDTEAFKIKMDQTLAIEQDLLEEIARTEKERASWSQKYSGYQKEVAKWKKETDRNKKLFETHQKLAE